MTTIDPHESPCHKAELWILIIDHCDIEELIELFQVNKWLRLYLRRNLRERILGLAKKDFTDDIDDYFAFPVAAGALRKMVQTLRMLHQSILELIPLIQWREEDEVFVSEHEKIRVLYLYYHFQRLWFDWCECDPMGDWEDFNETLWESYSPWDNFTLTCLYRTLTAYVDQLFRYEDDLGLIEGYKYALCATSENLRYTLHCKSRPEKLQEYTTHDDTIFRVWCSDDVYQLGEEFWHLDIEWPPFFDVVIEEVEPIPDPTLPRGFSEWRPKIDERWKTKLWLKRQQESVKRLISPITA